MRKVIGLLLMLPVFLFAQKNDTTMAARTGQLQINPLPSKWTDATGAYIFKVNEKGDTIVYSKWQTSGITASEGIGKRLDLWATPADRQSNFTITKQDTIPVIMLVCDTLKRPSENVAFYETSPQVWWKPGFMVYEMQWGSIPCNSGNSTIATTQACFGWYREKFITHLDRRKKALEPYIVVWQVKEINQ